MKFLPGKSEGFTLIELILVMAVFLFIIAAALGIFISVISNQRKILAEQEFLSQTSYLEEYMAKAIRSAKTSVINTSDTNCLPAGQIYLLTRQVSGFYDGIKFINQSDNNSCQEFFWDSLGNTANPYALEELKYKSDGTTTDSDAVLLTPSSLKINLVRFAINGKDGSVANQECSGNPDQCGAKSSDGIQPRVSVLLNIHLPADKDGVNRTVQTMVSQRNLNIKK